jgi:hypothetical protein
VLVTAPNSQEGSQQQPAFKGRRAAEIALSNPLEPETRKARLYLLGVSLVGITIVRTGLVPQELSTLGITFGQADRQSLLGILALVIVYFTLAFAVYGFSDFLAWRFAYSNVRWSEVTAETKRSIEASNTAFEEEKSKNKKVEVLNRKVLMGLASLPEELQRKVHEVLEAGQKRDELESVQPERSVPLLPDRPATIENAEQEIGDEYEWEASARAAQEDKRAAWEQAYRVAQEDERNLAEKLSRNVANLPEELQKKVEDILEAGSELREANSEVVMLRVRQATTAAAGLATNAAPSPMAVRTLGVSTLPFAPAVSWVRALFEFLLPLLVGFYAIYTLLST